MIKIVSQLSPGSFLLALNGIRQWRKSCWPLEWPSLFAVVYVVLNGPHIPLHSFLVHKEECLLSLVMAIKHVPNRNSEYYPSNLPRLLQRANYEKTAGCCCIALLNTYVRRNKGRAAWRPTYVEADDKYREYIRKGNKNNLQITLTDGDSTIKQLCVVHGSNFGV